MVDDDNRLRRLLQRYLTEHGYHVSTAADAAEAKAALNEARAIASGSDAGYRSQLAHVDLVGAQMALSLGNRAEATARAAAARKAQSAR